MNLPRMQATPFTVPFLVIGVLMAWLTYVSWRRRCFPGALSFTFLLAAISGWTLINGIEKSLVDHEWRRGVSTFLYLFIVTTPAAWFVFAVRYSRRDGWLNRRTAWLLFLEPLAVLLLAFTDSLHGLFRANTRMTDDGGMAVMLVEYGPLFWIHVVYSYSLFLAGATFVMLGLADRKDRASARQIVLLLAMLSPAIGNAIYVFGLQPLRHTDLTPIYFAVTGIGAFWMLFHVRIFDILPVARHFVLDQMADAVFVVDRKQRILDKNRAAEAYLGSANHSSNHRSLTELLPPLEPLLLDLAEESRELEIPFSKQDDAAIRPTEETIRHTEDRILLARATVMREGNTPIATLVTLVDVTDRRRLETERREFELALQQTQKVESLGALAGGIAHDFNNLLAAILLNAEMARDEVEPGSETSSYLRGITDAVTRATSLTGQMMAYSGKAHFPMSEFNLNETIFEMRSLLEAAASSSGSLELDLAEQPAIILGDRAQVRQVLVNLVTNAAEALEKQTGSIRIRTRLANVTAGDLKRAAFHTDLVPGVHWMLEVTDTGIGVDSKNLPKIFDPFFSTKFAGRGLGLAAVLGIVRGHGGAIFVESERGVGTDFRVVFPRVTEPATLRTQEHQASLSSRRDSLPTVLVVDDEEVVRDAARRILEGAGYRIMTATNGADAVWLHDRFKNEIDVVVVDLTMPLMRGDEVFHKLRDRSPELPIILSSGFDERNASALIPGDSKPIFLQKPYRVPDLLATVRNAISACQAARTRIPS
ncbi:MAG: histidine kinase N-terminal 7TM domain-containing protein [Planctomycetota bacterium]